MVQPVRINHAGALIAEDTRVFEETGHLHPDSMCPDSSSEEVLIFQLKSLWEEVITWLFFFFLQCLPEKNQDPSWQGTQDGLHRWGESAVVHLNQTQASGSRLRYHQSM